MARIDIRNETLLVHVEGFDKVRAMKSSLAIPLRHILGVELNPSLEVHREAGWTVKGTYYPGRTYEGTFKTPDGDVFCDVHNPAQAIGISLIDEPYTRLVLEVPNERPESVKARIEQALS
jgi:hypothetical protein